MDVLAELIPIQRAWPRNSGSRSYFSHRLWDFRHVTCCPNLDSVQKQQVCTTPDLKTLVLLTLVSNDGTLRRPGGPNETSSGQARRKYHLPKVSLSVLLAELLAQPCESKDFNGDHSQFEA